MCDNSENKQEKMTSTAELVTNSVNDLTVKKQSTLGQKLQVFKQKIAYTREVITVEPIIGAYVMAATLCQPTLFNLEFEKSCRVNLALNDTVCEAILSGNPGNFTNSNNAIQILISNMHSWQQPLQSIMPLILVLFLGSFSDRHKWRKPFLLMPLIGEFLSVIGCVLCVVFMRSLPLEAQGVFQTVLPSFFGGQTMIVMATYAYIADVSSLEMRTLRVGIVQIVLNIIVPVTQLFAGDLFELAGYYVIFLLTGGLYVFAFLYCIFGIKEPREPVKASKKELIKDVFNPMHAIDTFKLVLQKVPGNNLLYIWLVLITLFIYAAVVDGEASVFYLFVQKHFHWTVVQYSYFLSINTVIHLVGTVLAVPLFTKILNLTDMMILLLTFIDKILANIIFGLTGFPDFANINWLYGAAAVSFITGVTPVGIRSLATKIVSENDLGKAQSLFGICEALAPAIAIPIYNKGIYNQTLTDMASAFFFFGIILYLFCCIIIGWIYIRERFAPKVGLSQQEQNANEIELKKSNGDNALVTHL